MWREPVRKAENAAANLGEQHGGLRVLKRVSSNQHGVQRDAQAPDVCSAACVRAFPIGQQLGADVGGAAVSVCQGVVILIVQEDAVVEAKQSETCPAQTESHTLEMCWLYTAESVHFFF